jgi:ornithine cyclodeaminase
MTKHPMSGDEGRLPDFPAWCVTTKSGAHSVLQLHDTATGGLLAVMDSVHLATLRASLVGALAADVLARSDAKHVAVLGSGAAASGALKALRLVRSIEHVWVNEENEAQNFARARALATSMSMDVHAVDSVEEAIAAADLVLMTGGVSLGELKLRAGTHVSVVHANAFNFAPLAPSELKHARAFSDGASPWASAQTLGEVLRGAPGRVDADDVTLFVGVSPPQLDLIAAFHVFEGARHDEALTRLDLES